MPRESRYPSGDATRADDARDFVVVAEADRFWAASEAARFARSVGFAPRARAEIAVAVAEMVSNAVRYAGGGTLSLRRMRGGRPGIEVVVADRGVGLVDLEHAITDGVSRGRTLGPDTPRRSGDGLGVGFGTIKRMMTEIEVRTLPGHGTVVTARRWHAR